MSTRRLCPFILFAIGGILGCSLFSPDTSPTATPDRSTTGVAEQRAITATLTTEALTFQFTPTPQPTNTITPTPTPIEAFPDWVLQPPQGYQLIGDYGIGLQLQDFGSGHIAWLTPTDAISPLFLFHNEFGKYWDWSPDGNQLVYLEATPRENFTAADVKLWVLDLTIGEKRLLQENLFVNTFLPLHWLPDRNLLAYGAYLFRIADGSLIATIPGQRVLQHAFHQMAHK
jgi:hypothetical protein